MGLVALLCLSLVHLTQGTADVGAAEVWQWALGRAGGGTADVVLASRLPRLGAGLLVGVALGASGATLQSVARNRLASPDTLAERRTASGAWLEVRYSPECGTSWARMWGTRVGDRLEFTAGGPVRAVRVKDAVGADSFRYTPMAVTRPGAVLRACFLAAGAGATECFTSAAP